MQNGLGYYQLKQDYGPSALYGDKGKEDKDKCKCGYVHKKSKALARD